MTLHIVKLCVGADSVADLEEWQDGRLAEQKRAGQKPRLFHTTRMVPKQQDEVLDGGSLFWVIKGVIQVRQRIVGFDSGHKADGTPCCLIMLDRKLVPVQPAVRKAFQGWRYLTPEDAPADLAGGSRSGIAQLPPKMRQELAELGLL